MTAKTHGYITKEIELEQIYQFVLKYFDRGKGKPLRESFW